MAGENDPTVYLRTQRGEEVGLGPRGVGIGFDLRAVFLQMGAGVAELVQIVCDDTVGKAIKTPIIEIVWSSRVAASVLDKEPPRVVGQGLRGLLVLHQKRFGDLEAPLRCP